MKALAVALLLAAAARPVAGAEPAAQLLRSRPYRVHVPKNWDGKRPLPLVLLLHCYSCNGPWIERYLQLDTLADEKQFLVAIPEGRADHAGKRFWASTDACCNFDRREVDDVAYLTAVLDDLTARHPVDRKRVFAIGFSNGGFMAHRLACDLAPRLAGIASIAGAGWKNDTRCAAEKPVAILQIHGDADRVVPMDGGRLGGLPEAGEAPSAMEVLVAWAKRDGCRLSPATEPPIDLDASVDGAETTVLRWPGCAGGAVELWTLHGVAHTPEPRPDFAARIYQFLAAHPKP